MQQLVIIVIETPQGTAKGHGMKKEQPKIEIVNENVVYVTMGGRVFNIDTTTDTPILDSWPVVDSEVSK